MPNESGRPARGRNDPDGRRALFSIAESQDSREAVSGEEIAFEVAEGREALFSAAGRRPGTVLLTCERCTRSSRVSVIEFARMHLPFHLWFPWRSFSHLMVCPICEKRSWLRVGLFE